MTDTKKYCTTKLTITDAYIKIPVDYFKYGRALDRQEVLRNINELYDQLMDHNSIRGCNPEKGVIMTEICSSCNKEYEEVIDDNNKCCFSCGAIFKDE